MVDRTLEEKTAIVNKVCDAMGSEAYDLRHAGNKDASNAILNYLASNDEESFVRLYDILRSA